uniref:Uncharacterized protein n=1 Tax=Rhizophora mucronata TaxID=61149 RepID=A0A2P2Q5A9_RHIMU
MCLLCRISKSCVLVFSEKIKNQWHKLIWVQYFSMFPANLSVALH